MSKAFAPALALAFALAPGAWQPSVGAGTLRGRVQLVDKDARRAADLGDIVVPEPLAASSYSLRRA